MLSWRLTHFCCYQRVAHTSICLLYDCKSYTGIVEIKRKQFHFYVRLQEYNPPSACIRCVPMMLNGFGWIQPYTLPLGTYKNVMHGQYNHLAPQDKAQWIHAHKGTQSAAKGLSSGWQARDMNAADGPGMGSRSSVMMQSQISGWSGTTSTGVQQSDITLDQWLSQLGIAHYSQVLKGLTIAQVMDMDQHKLQEAGVITSSAIMRIQHAKEITRHFCK